MTGIAEVVGEPGADPEAEGCRELLLAVLELAIRDLVARRKTDLANARRWLLDRHGWCPLYCELLGIEWEQLARRVEQQPQSIRERMCHYSRMRPERARAWA